MIEVFAGEFISVRNVLFGIAIALSCRLMLSHLYWLLTCRGPWGVPVLGYYPFLKNDFYVHLRDLSREHGDAYTINLAGQTFLYLNNLKAVRDAHLNRVQDFPGRSTKHGILHCCFANSLMYLTGDRWRHQRKFLSQAMRDVGLGPHKEELRGPIGETIRSTISALKETRGKPIDVSAVLSKECANAITSLVLGENVSKEDQTIISNAYMNMVLPMGDVHTLLIGKISKYLILPWVRGYSEMIASKNEMAMVIRKIIRSHRDCFNPNQPPKDLIDFYLREIHVREKKGDQTVKYFDDEILVPNLMLAYGDGSVGLGAFLASFFRDLSQNPNSQDQIYKEIVDVIGTERQPTWEDRKDLPLTISAIKELFRISLFFPVYPSLECDKDTTVCGTKVPKGSITLVNNWALHHDPKLYKNPDKFDITRFLPGQSKEEDPYAFGIGKRACAGESLVMTETFLYITSLLQNFKFLPSDTGIEPGSPYEEATQCRLRVVIRSSTHV